MTHELKFSVSCYLCEKHICNANRQVKILCERCIERLEKQEVDFVRRLNREIDKMKNSKHFKRASDIL